MPYFKESLYIDISIHAPHEGERQGVKNVERKDDNISIHAPHEGERRCAYPIWLRQPLSFQSTLPTRGSDASRKPFGIGITAFMNFNPRSPRGGATRAALRVRPWATNFNPRSPRGGATGYHHGGLAAAAISIHAPHEGERPSYCLA